MNFCDDCSIENNLKYCCYENPETGDDVELVLNSGKVVLACPELGVDGKCTDYDNRTISCMEYECPPMRKMDLVDLMKHNSLG